MQISLVIPAHNEADNVSALLSEIARVLNGVVEYEIVFVDDRSTDNTVQKLIAIRDKGLKNLRIYQHGRRCGQSAAISTGVRAACTEWIVTLDGDGQNDPADIPRLLAFVRSMDRPENLLVTGLRVRRQDNILKRLSSRIANGVRRALLDDGTPDTGCGLKLFSRRAFLELPQFDHMHRFLPALFRRSGATVKMIEVNHRPRRRGLSKYGIHDRLWAGIVDLLGVMWSLRRNHRADGEELA